MCLGLLWMSPAQAQQVLSNGGGSFENGGTTMTFTIGETVIGTFSQANGIMTQGFNQAQLAPELQLIAESGALISGAELLFSTIEPGGSINLVLTIRNGGNGPFSISALNFTGDPVFTIDESISFPLTLQASGEQMLTLRFSPEQADDYSGQLTIEHTDAGATQPFIVNLSASAIIADLPLMPWSATLLLSLLVISLAIRSIRYPDTIILFPTKITNQNNHEKTSTLSKCPVVWGRTQPTGPGTASHPVPDDHPQRRWRGGDESKCGATAYGSSDYCNWYSSIPGDPH